MKEDYRTIEEIVPTAPHSLQPQKIFINKNINPEKADLFIIIKNKQTTHLSGSINTGQHRLAANSHLPKRMCDVKNPGQGWVVVCLKSQHSEEWERRTAMSFGLPWTTLSIGQPGLPSNTITPSHHPTSEELYVHKHQFLTSLLPQSRD